MIKSIVLSTLLCLCITVSAQQTGSFTISGDSETSDESSFSLNTPQLPLLEEPQLNLKLPTLISSGEFKVRDTWVMPMHDFVVFARPGVNVTEGLLGSQQVNTIKLFNTKIVNSVTYDAAGNMVGSKMTFR